MEKLLEVKLEPKRETIEIDVKIENEEQEKRGPKSNEKSGSGSNGFASLEEQPGPSSSASTTRLLTQENSSDSDESIDDNIEVSIPQQPKKVYEVVDIDSDSEQEEAEDTSQAVVTPRRAGLRQRRNGACFKDSSDSDDSEEVISSKRKKFANPEKLYTAMDEPSKLLRKLKKKNSEADVVLEKYTKCIIDGAMLSRRKLADIELDAVREILEKHGKIIEGLSMNKFSWEEKKLSSDYSPLNLYAILTKLCKNLGVLKFGGQFTGLSISPSKSISLPNLREIHYTCGEAETAIGNDRDNVLHTLYLKIFQGANSLEKLEYIFLNSTEADQILKALKDATETTPLKCFKKLKLQSSKEDGVMKQQHMSSLSLVKLPNLEHLELGNGLWEDIQVSTFEKVISKFQKLQTLIIHGSLQGDSSSVKSEFYVNFPRLDKLITLSIGADYEFESIIQNPFAKKSNIVTVKETTLEFLKFQIRLPKMPSLKSIVLGNLINIDKLTFKDLPNLKVFKVGGPWNQTCNFLGEEPHLNITDLQFPDALKDSSLSKRIPEMFPLLEKVWIFLPSVLCLRGFFEAMANATHVKIEELYLKTQFDFESTLESCLLGRSTASLRSEWDISNLNLLKRYSHFEEYVKYYNIELPIVKHETDEEISSPGIGVLKSLKVLQMEHIPRVLRIPIGKYHWSDHRCNFTEDTIGFNKYPLSQKCINELPVKNLETCLWPNFELTGVSLRKLQESGLSSITRGDYLEYMGDLESNSVPSTSTSSGPSRRQKLRVTIQPSMLRMADFKVKSEVM